MEELKQVSDIDDQRPKVEIELTHQTVMAIVQGKDIFLDHPIVRVRLRSPFEGTFLTYKEIDQIKYESTMAIFDLLNKVRKDRIHTQKEE